MSYYEALPICRSVIDVGHVPPARGLLIPAVRSALVLDPWTYLPRVETSPRGVRLRSPFARPKQGKIP
jgi:hypothetical protein